MIQYQFFPRSQGITPEIKKVIDCFLEVNDKIDSDFNNLKSNGVLKELYKPLTKIGYSVETSKAKDDKIDVPVLFGLGNQIDKSYNADALSEDGKIVIEVEDGRATENNQYMKVVLHYKNIHMKHP
tara:strand:+ start:4472 stop:4849 length:378 start_codon:yes stop_codon:yes gene_type:complete